jgi:hypothetical protein
MAAMAALGLAQPLRASTVAMVALVAMAVPRAMAAMVALAAPAIRQPTRE